MRTSRAVAAEAAVAVEDVTRVPESPARADARAVVEDLLSMITTSLHYEE
jgi:hypothetical protein